MPALPSFSVRYHSLSGTPQILVISRVSGQTTLKLRRRQASMSVFLVTFIIAFSPVLKFSFYHHFSDNDNLKSRVLFACIFLQECFMRVSFLVSAFIDIINMLEKFQKNLWNKVGRNSAAKLLWNFTNKLLPKIAKTTF